MDSDVFAEDYDEAQPDRKMEEDSNAHDKLTQFNYFQELEKAMSLR